MIDKRSLRRELRAARDAVAREGSVLVAAEFRARLAPGMIVASYSPVGSEADPAPLTTCAATAGCTLALPFFVDCHAPLAFRAWLSSEPLAPGPFGHAQPSPDAPLVAPDIFLTPLVGFDRRGNRLGQGRGHYDRAFAAHPAAWRVGVAWACQEVAALPVDSWDVALHAIATEREWIAI